MLDKSKKNSQTPKRYKRILKLQKDMHYFENVIIPINQGSNCLFISVRKNDDLKKKWNTITIH